MIAQAARRHSSASATKKSDQEQTKIRSGSFQRSGAANVASAVRWARSGLRPYRMVSRYM